MSDAVIENYLVTVAIPLRKTTLNQPLGVFGTEESKILMENVKSNIQEKDQKLIDTIMGYGECSCAKLYAMEYKDGRLRICFCFKIKALQDYFINISRAYISSTNE